MASPLQTSPRASHSIRKPDNLAAWLFQPNVIFRLGMVLILCLYARTIGFDFVYDDLTIPVSPWIQSWHGVIDAFKHDIFASGGQVGSSYYRPFAPALVVIIARLTPGTAAWYHLASLVVELIVYFVAFSFGRLFFENDTLAAFTALLFALHPAKVETTTWIASGFCDGQAAIYFFGVLICYLQWWKVRKPAWLAASVAFFAAALFTKETMIVIPALIAVHYWLLSPPVVRIRKTSVLMIPYAAVGALYAFARHAVLRPLPPTSIAMQPRFTLVNLWSAPVTFWWYIKRLLFPSGLSILYDSIVVQRPSVRAFVLPLVGVLLLACVAGWAWYRSRSRRFVFLLVWFLLALGPVIALSPMVTVHDRYLQLAAYPYCALVAFIILWVVKWRPQFRAAAVCFALALIVAWSVSTWHESGFWDDSVKLWGRAVQIAPHNINARVELARLYAENNMHMAIRVLDDGLQLLPTSPGLWRTRGLLQFNAGAYEEARSSLMRALDASARFATDPHLEPTDVKYGRATAAFFLGQIEMIEGNPSAADPWLRMAIRIDPDNIDYERVMVRNLRKQGLDTEADSGQKLVDELVAATSMKSKR